MHKQTEKRGSYSGKKGGEEGGGEAKGNLNTMWSGFLLLCNPETVLLRRGRQGKRRLGELDADRPLSQGKVRS